MSTTKRNSSSAGSRSTTPSSREPKIVRVWSEYSLTLCITENPNQYVKLTHGFEKLARNDSAAELARVEQEIYETCEAVVNKRLRQVVRMIKQIERG